MISDEKQQKISSMQRLLKQYQSGDVQPEDMRMLLSGIKDKYNIDLMDPDAPLPKEEYSRHLQNAHKAVRSLKSKSKPGALRYLLGMQNPETEKQKQYIMDEIRAALRALHE
jgi:hypothetical protein